MDRNPYAPPNAAIDDVKPTGLKRRSVLLMIAIFIVTLGLYFPIWFLRRRAALNRLDSPTELRMWPFLMYGGYFVLEFITAFMVEFAPDHANARELAMFVTGLRMITSIVMIVQCFVVRSILEDHLAGPDDAVSYPERSGAGEALRTHDLLFPHLLLTMGHKPLYRRRTTRSVQRRYDLKRAYSSRLAARVSWLPRDHR